MKHRRFALFALLWIAFGIFSFPSAPAGGASSQPPITITFETDEVGKPPQGWRAKGDAAKVYAVRSEEGAKYVRATAENTCVPIGYDKPWSLGEYRMLEWRWRAVTFPAGSDERTKAGDDSALGLYVIFGHWPFVKFIKYVWSDSVPQGETFKSPYSSATTMIVVTSGRAQAGTWVTQRRDVLADYRHLFNDAKPPVARGIAIMTDSDTTCSRAVGDYAAIRSLAK